MAKGAYPMASSIGIKIANGDFFPLVEENSSIKKRLILTTVHDDQPSVQIDLYRSPINDMSDAQYIGTVVVENIKQKPKGEPSIEMIISSDENGNITADAIDLDNGANGEHYILTVSLKSIDDLSRDVELPDFELESNEEPPSGLYQHASKIRRKIKSHHILIIVIIAVFLLLLGLFAAWLYFFDGLSALRALDAKWRAGNSTEQSEPVKQEAPAEPAVVSEPARQIEPAVVLEPVRQTEPVQQVITPPPVIQAPSAPVVPAVSAARTASSRNPPVASYNVPAVIPREGINYVIRWGDTLWDISEAFYRDPWQYPIISRFNSISNPNHIISGRTVRIPPRNN